MARKLLQRKTFAMVLLGPLLFALAAASSSVAQSAPLPTGSRPTEHAGGFSLARLKYTGGGDWYSDETSLVNLLKALRAKGEVRVGQDKEAVVTATDPDLWNYPMLFVTGHGNVKLNDEELRSLRRYLDQGGFLWADDNFGIDKSFRELMRKLYPETPLVELPFTHPLFQYPTRFPGGAPKVHEHDGGPARVFAVIRNGRIVVLYTFDCDIGNGIEDDLYNDPPAKRDAAMAFAINIATYAVTN